MMRVRPPFAAEGYFDPKGPEECLGEVELAGGGGALVR